jgi:enterochelin esterase-like enzyme
LYRSGLDATQGSGRAGYVRDVLSPFIAPFLAALAVTLPGFAPYATGPDGGQVVKGVFPGTERPGFVYLPPNYDPAERYPVVYLLHGMPGSPDEYLYGTDLPQWADAAITAATVRPFIAVMPAAGPDGHYNGEWAGPLATDVAEVIVPWVDVHLPTLPDAADRTIAGLSAGGYGAVDIALRHPSLFGRVESWSGYFTPLRDGPFKEATAKVLAANDPTLLVRAEAPFLGRSRVRFFVSTGPSHSHWFRAAQSLAFAHELRTLGLPVSWHVYGNAKGEWRAQLDTGLAWAFHA